MEGFPAKAAIISGICLPTRLRAVASTLSSHCNADKLSVLTAVCGVRWQIVSRWPQRAARDLTRCQRMR